MTQLFLPLLAFLLLSCYASASKIKPYMALLYRSTAPSRTYRHQNVAKNEAEGYIDEIYNVVMELGNSRQKVNLTLDYGWGPTFLFGSGQSSCRSPKRQKYNNNCVQKRERLPRVFVDAKKSRTFFNTELNYGFTLESPFTRDCGKFPIAGDLVEDQVKFEKSTFSGLPYVFTPRSLVEGLLHPGWSADGILGLGYWSGFFGDSTYSFILKMLDSFEHKMITVYLGNIWRHQYHLRNEPAGYMTMGARDDIHCKGNWKDIQASWTYGWSVVLDTFNFGSYRPSERAGVGVFASPTAYIYAPKRAKEAIVSLTHAEYDPRTDVYFVDCSKIGTFPDMKFTMQGFNYYVAAKYYARQMYVRGPNRQKQCVLLVGESSRDDTWFLGTTFNRPYCMLFDFTTGNMKLSFSPAKMD